MAVSEKITLELTIVLGISYLAFEKLGCPCRKLSPDAPSQASQHKRPRASVSVLASL